MKANKLKTEVNISQYKLLQLKSVVGNLRAGQMRSEWTFSYGPHHNFFSLPKL